MPWGIRCAAEFHTGLSERPTSFRLAMRSFSSLFCYALFQSRKLCGTFLFLLLTFVCRTPWKAKPPVFFKLSSVFAFLQKIIQTTLLVVWIIAYFHKIGLCRGIFILLPIPLCVPILSDLLENIKGEELEGDRKRIGTFLIGKKTIKIQSDAADL